jgi:hypothetical protein
MEKLTVFKVTVETNDEVDDHQEHLISEMIKNALAMAEVVFDIGITDVTVSRSDS